MFNPTRTTFTDQRLNGEQVVEGTISHFKMVFKTFLYEYTVDHVKVYMKQINRMINEKKFYISIQLSDLKNENDTLYESFVSDPLEKLGIMESCLKEHIQQKKSEFPPCDEKYSWQIIMVSDDSPRRLRDVTSADVQKLFVVQGIIISATKPYIKAKKLKLKCKGCGVVKQISMNPGQNPYVPMICTGGSEKDKCPNDPFVAMPDSEVIDVQTLKIQESPEEIPTGEIARTYQLFADRYNVGKCVPGDRLRISGIMIIDDGRDANISKGKIYVTGMQKLKERTSFQYTQNEEETFKKMSRDPKLYDKIHKSIAPGIYGNDNIKRSIACMLFGGARKFLPDQTILRGDINILLLGDPSTAKSQFLKFVDKTAAICVYTSGKGSSAAGLTASITKDQASGEFQIEGGALVLADGGIVCIDEFDKMRSEDRVAIHEAMEQQTISIAKAGITTRLNSRTSILAAANPIHGSIADSKSVSDQIELQQTILSRFDCIFIVKDINTEQNNTRIADHVLGLHQGKIMSTEIDQEDAIPFELLKKYISYARNKIKPRLTVQASDKLEKLYVEDRKKAREHKVNNKKSIPITVRQLEAIIRLSESIAKMKLSSEVTEDDVDEAHYLFEISTMKTISGDEFGYPAHEALAPDIQKAEEMIRNKVPMGNDVSVQDLCGAFKNKFSETVMMMAIRTMIRNNELREIKNNKYLKRER